MTQAVSRQLFAPAVLLAVWLAPMPRHGNIAGIPSLCLFHRLTGLPCPGCGFTRSLVCCAHGHWSEAVFYHPLGPVLFASLVVWSLLGIARIVRAFTGGPEIDAVPWARRNPLLIERAVRFSSVIALLLLAGVWFARMLKVIPSPP